MKTITLDQVMAKKPCARYPRSEIAKWFPGQRPTLRKLFDVALENGVSNCDLIFHFTKYLDKKMFVFFSCDCVERELQRIGCKDERSWNAIQISRLHVQGKASKEKMYAAAEAAEAAATAEAAKAAEAAYAAAYAAYDAYADADDYAAEADATECKWQLDRLLEYMGEV